MNETKLVRPDFTHTIEPAAENTANEIRVLDEMELLLAGGGDHTDGWP